MAIDPNAPEPVPPVAAGDQALGPPARLGAAGPVPAPVQESWGIQARRLILALKDADLAAMDEAVGSHALFIPGIFVFAAGLTLQAGATSAVKTVKMSASLISGRRQASD